MRIYRFIVPLVVSLCIQLGFEEKFAKEHPVRIPNTAEVSDTEFYFSVPFDILDPFLWADENNIPQAKVCEVLSLTQEQYMRLKRNIDQKSKATRHLLEVPPALSPF